MSSTYRHRNGELKNPVLSSHKRYEQVIDRFLQDPSEEQRYKAMLLGREMLKHELGPTEAVQLHFNVTDRLRQHRKEAIPEELTDRLKPLLIEIMMVYSESHQEVKHVLGELQTEYTAP